jgi:hypothetical protein
MSRSIAYILLLLYITSLILACQPVQTQQSEMLKTTSISISSLSDTPSSTITKTYKPVSTVTPSTTPNPFGTQIVSIPFVPEDKLFEPFDTLITNFAVFEDMPSGVYLVDRVVSRDNNTEELLYFQITDSILGRLLTLENLAEFLHLDKIFFDNGETKILGGYPVTNTRYLFDLSNQEVLQFTICNEGWDEGNHSGRLIATICTESGQIQSGKINIEIISLNDRTSFTLEIPSHSEKRYASNRIHWVGNDSFIAYIGYSEEPCIVNIPNLGMHCAPSLIGKPLLSISPAGTYLLTNRSRGYSWIKDIHLMECFQDRMKCDPIATLDDEYTSSDMMYWSPDETMLAVDFGDHLTSTTAEIGYYDTETWTYHQVGIFPRSSGFFDWCPDSSCMIIVGDPSYILYLDGTREEIPHDLNNPIAVIEVP